MFILNDKKFEFKKGTAGIGSSAGFYWSLRHLWGGGIPNTNYAAATMGEFFITKKWWMDIEGMDDGMRQWGGENIDISLRTWLCGGEIRIAKTSYLAHAFRTVFPYPVSQIDVFRNSARSAEVWLGEKYIDKFYTARSKKRGSVDIGNISSIFLIYLIK